MGSAPPPPVSLRVMVRADDLDAFVERYSHFIDGDRIFIFTKSAKNVGERLRFALCLANGEPVLHGEGVVTRVQKDADASRPPGMELRFKALDDSSQTLVDFLLATRADLGSGGEIQPPNLASPNLPSMKVPLKDFLNLPSMKSQPPAPARPAAPSTASFPAISKKPSPSSPLPSSPAAPAATPIGSSPSEAPPMRMRRPTPVFADIHVVPPAPGTVPANPFSQVSDNAIEYFVEWSLESSVGPHKESTASFSDVPMALPDSDDHTGEVRRPRRIPLWAMILGGVGFAAGLTIGIIVGVSHKSPQPPVPTPVVTAPAPPPPAPAVAVPTTPPPVAAAPAPKKLMLSVRSRPSGAVVLLDGKRVGVTPLEVPASPGAHKLSLSHERYSSSTTDAEAPGSVDIPLQRPAATLVISANLPGAMVTVSGAQRGNAPVRLNVRAYEKYKVEVSARGAPPWRRSVYVKAPSTEIKANLGVARR
jgi:hypothetical protein